MRMWTQYLSQFESYWICNFSNILISQQRGKMHCSPTCCSFKSRQAKKNKSWNFEFSCSSPQRTPRVRSVVWSSSPPAFYVRPFRHSSAPRPPCDQWWRHTRIEHQVRFSKMNIGHHLLNIPKNIQKWLF